MITRTAIGLAAIVAMASTTALAADLSSGDAAQLCHKLNAQYTYLEPFKEGLPYWATSSQAHKTGMQDCKSGKSVEGAEMLQTAISDLYVQPDTL